MTLMAKKNNLNRKHEVYKYKYIYDIDCKFKNASN